LAISKHIIQKRNGLIGDETRKVNQWKRWAYHAYRCGRRREKSGVNDGWRMVQWILLIGKNANVPAICEKILIGHEDSLRFVVGLYNVRKRKKRKKLTVF
jgi:hypothetical protein